jgi:4-oxalocrotonate tautomerase
MPLVEIHLSERRTPAERERLAAAVHEALVAALGIPEHDRFQLLCAVSGANAFIDPSYLGVERSADFVVVRITLRRGRSHDVKRALYSAITERARAAVGTRPEDVLVVLCENEAIDWSFGGGVAQYALTG